MSDKLRSFLRDVEEEAKRHEEEFRRKKDALRQEQRTARQALKEKQAERAQLDAVHRAARFRKGIGAAWDWLSGNTRRIRKQNEAEALDAAMRDAAEREAMIAGQLTARRSLQQEQHALYINVRDVREDIILETDRYRTERRNFLR